MPRKRTTAKYKQLKHHLRSRIFMAGFMLAATLFLPALGVHATGNLPQVSIANASTIEGSSGTHPLDFTVTLSEPSSLPVTLSYTTSSDWTPYGIGTATGTLKATDPNSDYVTPVNGSLIFNPGQVSKTISIKVVGDKRVEGNENFTVVLSNVQGATISDAYGSGTIIDDDQTAGFSLGIGDVSVREGNVKNRTVQVMIGFSDPAPAAFSLTTTTHSGTASGVLTAATKGGDFVSQTRTISVATGARFKVITITLTPDLVGGEGNQSFTVSLTSTLGSVTKPTGTVTILDDDQITSRAGRNPGAPRIALVGDSVTAGYTDYAKTTLENLGYAVSEHGVPGSSIIDADECTGQKATSISTTIDPDIIIFENIANYLWFPPCDASIAYGTPAFFNEWQNAAQQDTNILTSKNAQLYWVLNPSTTPGERHDAIPTINQIYSNIAANSPNIHTIDAFTPFGGDPPNCPAYRVSDCLHLNQAGIQLMTSLVTKAIQ